MSEKPLQALLERVRNTYLRRKYERDTTPIKGIPLMNTQMHGLKTIEQHHTHAGQHRPSHNSSS